MTQTFVGLDDVAPLSAPVTPSPRPNPTDPDFTYAPPVQPFSPKPAPPPPYSLAGDAPTNDNIGALPNMSVEETSLPKGPAGPATPAPPQTQMGPEGDATPPLPWLPRTIKSVADAMSGIQAESHAVWERDSLLGGLTAAQSDAIGAINDKVKATYGVELPDPSHGGYYDEAAKNVIARVRAGHGLQALVDPRDPETAIGGGDQMGAAVRREQYKLWDDARTALAAQHGASEATRDEAASVLQADTPAAQLGAKYSHAANVAEAQAWDKADTSTRIAMMAAGAVTSATNYRDAMTIPSLMVGGGMEPTMAKALYPLAAPAVRIASDITEQGVRQAIVNLGLTAVEAPAHQAANEARGEEHGIQPALKDIGTSALYGFIPGALIGGVKALGRAWGTEARTPVDEFIRQAYGLAPDEHLTDLIKEHFDAIHAWEEAHGLEKGSTYSDAGLRDRGVRESWGSTEPPGPPPPGAAPPPEPPRARPAAEAPRSAAAAPEAEPGAPRALAPPLWEGKPYPTPPDIPAASRQRPSPSSITPAAIESAEADHAALPASIPGVPPSEIMRAYKEAIQHAESPDVMAPPEPPMTAPPRADEGFLRPDHISAPAREGAAAGGIDQKRISDFPERNVWTIFVSEAAGGSYRRDMHILGDWANGISDHEYAIMQRVWGKQFVGERGSISDPKEMLARMKEALAKAKDSELTAGLTEPSAADGTIVVHHNDKPYTEGVRFDPRRLKTDSITYQYKSGGDENGVTARLRTVRQWSPMSAGNIVVHERLDGNQYVVDGHQRTGLANRIMDADSTQKIVQPGILLREADGWTAAEARTEAALKNIREGIGDTLDMAQVLRDSPEAWDDSLPVGRGDLKESHGLANLSEAAWDMARNNVVPRDYASLVGNMVPDKTLHVAIMDDLARIEPRTPNQARFVISDAMNAGFRKENQDDLFGTSEITRSLSMERSQVYDEATRLLRNDNRLFSMLDAQSGRIEEAGNVLVDTNADQATRAGQLAQALGALAKRAGPTSAALNRAAQTVAAGERPKTAARAFLTELPALLQQEGLKIPDSTAPPSYDVDTPKGRAEQTQDLEAEFMAAQPGLFGAPAKTLDEQRAAIHADIKQKLLDANMPEAQAEANAALVAARMATRAARMGRADPEQFYREQGWIVRGDRQREAEIAGAATEGAKSFEQPATVPTFYSAVERAIEGAKQAKASPEQWLAMVKNMPGVKPEEMKYLGLEPWLKSHDGPITRAEVADYVRANSIEVREVEKGSSQLITTYARAIAFLNEHDPVLDPTDYGYTNPEDYIALANEIRRSMGPSAAETKFPSYVLPEGEPGSYRELLLTLPEKDRITKTPVKVPMGWGDTGDGGDIGFEAHGDTRADYRSSHWDEPNVIAHVRFDDRTIEGRRALHMAEVQSDWMQAGRKRGFRPSQAEIDAMPKVRNWNDFMAEKGFTRTEAMQKWLMRSAPEDVALHNEHLRESEERAIAIARAQGGVPDAPFKTTWADLSLKRMVRYAAENGYDMLSWDTGATNADRYDLSHQVQSINVRKLPDGKFNASGMSHTGGTVPIGEGLTPERLADFVGKDLAEKITGQADEYHEYSGLDLKIGGSGMTGFYDKILPATVSKLTKKFGGKVEEATLSGKTAEQKYNVVRNDEGRWLIRGPDNDIVGWFSNQDQAAKIAAEWNETAGGRAHPPTPVHSLTITPQLRDAALNEGFPLFQASAEEPRGRVTMRDNSKVIDLFSKRNASTFPHEAGHAFLEEMAQDAADPNASAQIRDDFQTILDWLGAPGAESISEEQHEKWARGFEQYLREGKAPSSALERAFAAFKEWLKAIYRSLVGLGKEIPDSIRKVMDRMIATDEEIAAHRGAPAAEPARNLQAGAEPAPHLVTGDPLVDHVTADPYIASAIADPVINRKNDVPYGAGPNKANDRVVNVDRHVPKSDKIGGAKYDPARAVAVHEQVEKHVLDQLTAAGVPENEAYEIAHFVFAEPAERAWVEANVGPNAWAEYQAHWDKWLKPIDHENPKKPPPDLYQKPYPHDDDHLAPEDRGSDKTFEATGHRNLQEMRAVAERVLGAKALQGAAAEGRMGNLEATVRGVAHETAVAAAASPDPLDQQIGQILEREIAPLIDQTFPPATEAGPEGTQQTLMPGVSPVTGADRARLGAAAPLRGGSAAPPEGGLFDENATKQLDWRDMVPDLNGNLVDRSTAMDKSPLESALAQLVRDCEL